MPSQKVSKKAVSKTQKTQKTAAKKATTQKAGGKTTKVAKTTAPKVTKSAATKASKATQKAGGKKATPAKKAAPTKKAAPAKKVVQKAAGEKKEKTIRSFKVQLPGKEEYTGRFTGWTPYQAANKALSRYFRSTEDPKPVVTFSIRESTRGSNHKVYTYEGHRVKLVLTLDPRFWID